MRAAWQELEEQELEEQFNPRVVFLGTSVVQGIMEDWRQSRPLGNGYSGTLPNVVRHTALALYRRVGRLVAKSVACLYQTSGTGTRSTLDYR
eukprot:scaffold55645_cov32-Attheya_sp.AAC.1